ncbi:hypothetical protein [Brevundimonas sp.]|uniref:hypothetical protein n=1 Tax=Brevundimonas sp. TaxID=1871086 RepID=UPI0039C85431
MGLLEIIGDDSPLTPSFEDGLGSRIDIDVSDLNLLFPSGAELVQGFGLRRERPHGGVHHPGVLAQFFPVIGASGMTAQCHGGVVRGGHL